MNCNLGEREINILQFFLKNNDKEFTLGSVVKNFDFNSNNIKNSLIKIDVFLINNHFPSLKNGNNCFSLKSSYKEKISSILSSNFTPSKGDRITYLLFLLLTNDIVCLTEVSNVFNLNRKSIQLDLQDIKKLAKKYNLEITSINAKGISIHGDLFSKYSLFIQILIKILFQRDNPFGNNLYSKFCSAENREEILQLVKIISENLSSPLGIGIYYGLCSVFLANRNFSHIFPMDKISNRVKQLNVKKTEEILSQLNEINIPEINESKEILALILTKTKPKEKSKYNYFQKKSYLFIELLEEKLGKIPVEEKNILFNILELSIFRKLFLLNFFGDNLKFIDNEFSRFLSEICHKIDLDIYQHDFDKIYFFLKEVISLKNIICNSSYPKEILIIDGSLNNWMGNAIKRKVEENYYVDKIDVINYLEYFFNNHKKNYSLTFKLEIPPTFFSEIEELNWKAFFRDPTYLDSFNFCKKI